MGILNWFDKKKSFIPNMRNSVNYVEQDIAGNYWYRYLTDLFNRKGMPRTDYDMTNDADKAAALQSCTPFSTVIYRIGSMFANGNVYVVDSKDNERPAYQDIRDLLQNPNPLQNQAGFLKDIYIALKTFGYCPIYTARGFSGVPPKAMWVIPPHIFHMVSSGSLFEQTELNEIVSKAYISWTHGDIILEDYEYFVIYDSSVRVEGAGVDLVFDSPTDSLSIPVNNWIAAMSASHRLIVDGGPKGIISDNHKDQMGNSSLEPADKEELEDSFKRDYGILKKYPILVTKAKVNWIPLDYDASQLKLHEEDARCEEKICNAIGINHSIFSESKYDNQESAKRAGYQDLIIPDSVKVAEAITKSICPKGAHIKIDYTHISCLQNSKKEESEVLSKVADAYVKLKDRGLITVDEARMEIAKYIDIDPDKPKGELKSTTVKNEDNDEKEVKDDKQV